jgi:hypothetical protein
MTDSSLHLFTNVQRSAEDLQFLIFDLRFGIHHDRRDNANRKSKIRNPNPRLTADGLLFKPSVFALR